MKVKTAPTHIFEIEELACKITGLDYDEIDADSEIIENKLMDELGVDLQQFQEIVERLLPLIQFGESPLSETTYKGFANIDSTIWLVKMEAKP